MRNLSYTVLHTSFENDFETSICLFNTTVGVTVIEKNSLPLKIRFFFIDTL